jgi:hypothetical protein
MKTNIETRTPESDTPRTDSFTSAVRLSKNERVIDAFSKSSLRHFARELERELKEVKQELAAIQSGILNEFKSGEPSGDVLQDFGMFIDHHNKIEQELAAEKAKSERWREMAMELGKLVGVQGVQLGALLGHCDDCECPICAKIICPFKEPLHFHHDGCPSCCNAPKDDPRLTLYDCMAKLSTLDNQTKGT